jgi:hypothetical protein
VSSAIFSPFPHQPLTNAPGNDDDGMEYFPPAPRMDIRGSEGIFTRLPILSDTGPESVNQYLHIEIIYLHIKILCIEINGG